MYVLIVFAWHFLFFFCIFSFLSSLNSKLVGLNLSTLSQSVYICQWVSQFIKSLIECSFFSSSSLLQRLKTQIQYYTNLHNFIRLRVHNSIYMRNEKNCAKINIIAFLFFVFKKMKEIKKKTMHEKSITDFPFFLVFSPSITRYGSVSSFTWLLFASVTTLLMNLIVVQFIVLFSHCEWAFVYVCFLLFVHYYLLLLSSFFSSSSTYFFRSIALICLNYMMCDSLFGNFWHKLFWKFYISVNAYKRISALPHTNTNTNIIKLTPSEREGALRGWAERANA